MRDRVGIKPLYYSVHHGRLVFASEIKALLLDPQQERAVDEESLYHYLSFLCVPAPRTLFRGIRKLEPGCWLRVDADGQTEERRWWDAWDDVEPLTGVSDREIEERVLDELRVSVQLRKVSDVPVGVFLSGGVDSSTNAALFSEGDSSPVKTFSIGYDQDYPLVSERARVGAADGARGRRRSSRADPLARRPARLPAGDGAAAGRADCRSRVLPPLLRVGTRARARA